MAKLMPWEQAAPMLIKVASPSVTLRPIKPNKFALWRKDVERQFADFVERCENQPRILFWGSCTAAAILLSVFAFIFQEMGTGVLDLACGFVIRFGLVLGLLSTVELVRGRD